MPVKYKFIQVQNSEYNKNEMYHDKELIDNKINYEQVKNYFLEIGKKHELVEDDMINTKFIINNSQNMSLNEETDFLISSDETKIIFVFTVEKDTRAKLLKLFDEKGMVGEKKTVEVKESSSPDPNIVKPIPEEEIKITNDIIQESNKKTLELFGDKDFKTLLTIYKRNPDVFKTFSSYVCNGDVLVDSFESKISESFEYTEQLDQIKSLSLSIPDDKIIESLTKNRGHLNLSLRYLLYNVDDMINEKDIKMEIIE